MLILGVVWRSPVQQNLTTSPWISIRMLCLHKHQAWGIQNINICFPNILLKTPCHIHHNINEKCNKKNFKTAYSGCVCNWFLFTMWPLFKNCICRVDIINTNSRFLIKSFSWPKSYPGGSFIILPGWMLCSICCILHTGGLTAAVGVMEL